MNLLAPSRYFKFQIQVHISQDVGKSNRAKPMSEVEKTQVVCEKEPTSKRSGIRSLGT